MGKTIAIKESMEFEMEFENWWRNEGSGICPIEGEYREEHAKRVAAAAWSSLRSTIKD